VWGSRSRSVPLTWVISVLGRQGMIVSRVPASGFLAVSSGFGDQVSVVPAWRVDEGVIVSLAA
jgi:hypothetical protein